jgi:hypothetical protein
MASQLKLTVAQHNALRFHCRLACETVHPRFSSVGGGAYIGDDTFSIVLTVNSGHE